MFPNQCQYVDSLDDKWSINVLCLSLSLSLITPSFVSSYNLLFLLLHVCSEDRDRDRRAVTRWESCTEYETMENLAEMDSMRKK